LTLPLTGVRVVETNRDGDGRVRVTPQGLVLGEIAPGVSVEEVQRATKPKLIVGAGLKVMDGLA
jgi:3-oxoacid CoA-transferase subunit B